MTKIRNEHRLFSDRCSRRVFLAGTLRAFALCVLAFACAAQTPTGVQRQPAPVMGVGGADWLIRPERIQEEEPDRMLAALEIRKGSVVADVGAGVGYHV